MAVFDFVAPYGLAIIKADYEEQVKEIIDNDPASKINKYEYCAMRAVFPGE